MEEIWIIKTGETVPIKKNKERLYRTAMLTEYLSQYYKIKYITSNFDHFSKKIITKRKIIKINKNLNIYFLNTLQYKKNFSIQRAISERIFGLKLGDFFNKQKKLPKLIICSYPSGENTIKAIDFAKKNNVKLIVDVRDMWPDATLESLSYLNKILFYPAYFIYSNQLKKIKKNVTKLTFTSIEFKKWYSESSYSNKNFKVIPIGYKKKFFVNNLNNIVKDIFSNQKIEFKQKKIFVYSGIINRYFNFYNVMKTIEKFSNFYFIIIGDGEDIKKLVSFKKENNLFNTIIVGRKNFDFIDFIYKKSHYALTPYFTKSFEKNVTNKFYEYLSYGLPIINSSGGIMKNLIKKENLGYNFNYNDDYQLESIFNKIRLNQNDFYQQKNNCFQLFKKNFSSEIIYKKYYNFIQEYLNE